MWGGVGARRLDCGMERGGSFQPGGQGISPAGEGTKILESSEAALREGGSGARVRGSSCGGAPRGMQTANSSLVTQL